MSTDERLREERELPMSEANFVAPPGLSHRQAGVRVVVGLALAGAVVGAGWAFLAPPIQIVIALTRAGDRVRGYVGDESGLVFIGPSLMIGLLTALTVTATVAVWQWRAHRGPVLVGALWVGALAAAGAATAVGAGLVRWRYGMVDLAGAPVSPEQRVFYTLEAPAVFFGHAPLLLAATIAFPAGVAALLYALFVLSTTRDDLGAWPPVEHPQPRLIDPVPTTGPAPIGAGDRPADPSSPSH